MSSDPSEFAEPPLVSVVIPCHNQARYLDAAIESALVQTYARLEIIVVDDGSSDDTMAVAARYPRVTCLRQERRGLSAARNAGAAAARGDCLAFLDADDCFLPSAVEVGVRHLTVRPAVAFVYGRYEIVSSDGAPLGAVAHSHVDREHYASLLRENFIAMHATVMYRRTFFDAAGGFDPSLLACEDYDLYLRLTRLYPIFGHGEVIALYRQHDSNMSRDPVRMLEASLAVLREQRGFVRSRADWNDAYNQGRRFWAQFYGSRVIDNVRFDQWPRRDWKALVRSARTLARHHPRGLAHLVMRSPARHLRRVRVHVASRSRGVARHLRGRSTGWIAAQPNPVFVHPPWRFGVTTVSWIASRTDRVEIRVDAPDGPLFSQTGSHGSATTGPWVRDGMTFYLQDVSGRTQGGCSNTLAAVMVTVEPAHVDRRASRPIRGSDGAPSDWTER